MNQRGFDNQPSQLTAAQVARLLGVKLQTVYAYASRGLLGAATKGPGRAARYPREAALRLKLRAQARAGHTAVAAGALRWGEPVLDTAVSEITEEGPKYRGLSAVELARRGVRWERVAELLWTGELPATATWPAAQRSQAGARETAPGLLHLANACLCAGLAEPDRLGLAPEAERARARALMRVLVDALARPEAAVSRKPSDTRRALGSSEQGARGSKENPRASGRLAHASKWAPGTPESGTRIARGGVSERRARATTASAAEHEGSVAAQLAVALGLRGATSAQLDALNAALVLTADHELNASTFAARVTAGTGGDLYACVAAALCALSGPRHGGACDRVEALLEEVRAERAGAKSVLRRRLARGEVLPGFEAGAYPQGDPRAPPLLAAALALGNAAAVEPITALVAAARATGAGAPALDLGLVALAQALGLPPGSGAALFALGRFAGWVAHVLEQRTSGQSIRPRARYVGHGEVATPRAFN